MEELSDSPYSDPAIISQSQGDRQLLDRLVARRLASELLAANGEDLGVQAEFQLMDEEVKKRQRELGILPPDESPGMTS